MANTFIHSFKQSVIFVFIAFVISSTSFAQEKIDNAFTEININTDGTINVTEVFKYDFGSTYRHGIIRELPIVKEATDNKYRLKIEDIKVTDSVNTPVPFVNDTSATQIVLKIGDPEKTVTGVNSYKISYKVSGSLTYFSDHDELYWNVYGHNWNVPVLFESSKIIFPKPLDKKDVKVDCFTGEKGSQNKNCSVIYHSDTGIAYITSTKELKPYQGVTVVIGFPKGIVEVLEPIKYSNSTEALTYLYSLSTVSLSLVTPVALLLVWLFNRKYVNDRQKIVAAWFDPPKHTNGLAFSPAEIQAIVEKKADHRSITATIIMLAQKGYLKIAVGPNDAITFKSLKNHVGDTALSKTEKMVLEGLFTKPFDSQEARLLEKSTRFATNTSKFGQSTLDSLYEQKMFTHNPRKTSEIFTLAALLSLVFVSPLTTISLFLFGKILPRLTDVGIEKYSEAKSLLNFLKSQDAQLDFQAKNQMFFEKLLPYATAFGVEDIWAKRFKDLNITQADWIEGTTLGKDMMFYSFLTHSIDKTATKSFAYSASKSSSGFSSGFSGGGHSGGGGGGGGGHSW